MPTSKLLAALVSASLLAACGAPLQPEGEQLISATDADLALAASAGKAAKPAPRPAPAPTYALKVSATSTNPVFASSFIIYSTYDLYFALDVTNATGAHSAVFEVVAPSGAVYQRTPVPFSAAGGTYRVWSSMPVAGTMIEQYAMTGTWTVRTFLDGGATAKATSSFVLQ